MFRRFIASLLAYGFPWLGAGIVGCGTEALGVDACLQIERARCEAADACGLSERLACERYIEVQCLHGFVKSAQPTDKQTKQCADALGQVAECVSDKGRKASANSCELELNESSSARACAFVESAYDLRACRFLTPPEEEGEDQDEDEDEDQEEDESTNAGDTSEDEAPSSDASAGTDAGNNPG